MAVAMANDIMSINDVAQYLGVSRGYIYILMRDGELAALPAPENTILKMPPKRFRRQDVEDLRARRLAMKHR